jgi:hypothetical protein
VVSVGLIVGRIRTGRWRLSRKLTAVGVTVAAVSTVLLVATTLGRVVPNLAVLVALSASAFAVAVRWRGLLLGG